MIEAAVRAGRSGPSASRLRSVVRGQPLCSPKPIIHGSPGWGSGSWGAILIPGIVLVGNISEAEFGEQRLHLLSRRGHPRLRIGEHVHEPVKFLL